MNSTASKKMTEGDPGRVILLFAIPMVLSNLFQQMYNVVDTLIVGKQLGTEALAAVGSASSITAVFVQLATGLALGGSIVVSQYYGAGRTEKIHCCMTTLTLFSAGVGLAAAVGIWIFAEPLLELVNTPAGIVAAGSSYLRFYFLGGVPVFVYNALGSIYVALGNSKAPLRFLVFSSIVNVGLDLFFIMVCHLGVGGAAMATAISQLLAAGLALRHVSELFAEWKPEKSGLFDAGLLGIMLRFALPSALQQSIVSVGSVIVQATINSFGASVMAGSAAAAKVVNLTSAIPISYSNAYSNYVGQNMGAEKEERIWPGLRSSIRYCGVISLLMTAAVELFAAPIIGLFVSSADADYPEVVTVGAEYIRVIGAFLVVFSVFMLLKATFKGSGDMTWFLITTLLSFLVRLLMTVGLAPVAGPDIIWWAFCAGWTVSLVVALWRYRQGGWKKKGILKEK